MYLFYVDPIYEKTNTLNKMVETQRQEKQKCIFFQITQRKNIYF